MKSTYIRMNLSLNPLLKKSWIRLCMSTLVCRLNVAKLASALFCCVTITWQQIFKGPLQVMIVNMFFRMWLFTSDIFGR